MADITPGKYRIKNTDIEIEFVDSHREYATVHGLGPGDTFTIIGIDWIAEHCERIPDPPVPLTMEWEPVDGAKFRINNGSVFEYDKHRDVFVSFTHGTMGWRWMIWACAVHNRPEGEQ